ncbi:YfcC family protein [Rhodococcus sp. HM1]|uniref:YfcC family protein n=1 Tax=Rhodococcus sp. HM1 TaxID=2937759 RepID=UPI00200A3B9F|nr:YfcC family protein [Rhodococcus sp. HM1]MCK8672270.1 YfcC family protein [Rhodococcus sp. HM1]
MSTDTESAAPAKKKFEFPGSITVLALVTVVVWLAALVIPSGRFATDEDGAPIPGSFEQIDSPLTFGERVRELILSPINGLYGIQDPISGFVDPDNLGRLFGSVGVVLFIMALGAFISVSFATRSLEVAVSGLGARLGDRGWLLIAVIMTLFSLLGSTMGFSVETFGFYALIVPLMLALGYDRMVAAATIIVGALTGTMASTVNPFSIGVASGEAGVSIGDGIVLRVLLWVVLTAVAVVFVVRYARRVQRDPSRSLVGFDSETDSVTDIDPGAAENEPPPDEKLSGVQKSVLAITVFTFGLMIFAVIPWSAIFGADPGPAEYEQYHETATDPYWFELNWWFPELAMLFVFAALLVGLVARMGEKKTVSLITQGAGDMVGPAIVIMLARGVSVILNNTETLDTVLNAMEQLVSGASSAVFAILVTVVNVPLAFLIPSSSGHATLAMPLLAPLGDFAGVGRDLVITAFQMGHGLMLLVAPTNVVVVGGLAMAKVGYDRYLRFLWPLLAIDFVIVCVIIGFAAAFE